MKGTAVTDTENRRKRLIYRSWHRGTREMDLLLGSFADRHVPGFGTVALEQYEDMLNISDPDLYEWATGRMQPPANLVNEVTALFLKHKFATGNG